jgi:tyrosine-protein kinase Etk/Wzc
MSLNDNSLRGILEVLHRWRKPIVYTTAGVGVMAVVISLLLPNYYKASTTFYAANEDLFKPQKIFGHTPTETYYYGTSDDIERILTVARSDDLTDFMVDSFHLYHHYGIDSTARLARFKVHKKFMSYYEIIRTKYDALELTFEDRDPEFATTITNAARDQINKRINTLIKSSQQRLLDSYVLALMNKKRVLETIYDSLHQVQVKNGIFDPEAQTEYLSTLVTSTEMRLVRDQAKLNAYKSSSMRGRQDSIAHLTTAIAGWQQQLAILNGKDSISHSYNIEHFNRAKGKVTLLDDAYRRATTAINLDQEKVKEMQSALALNVPALHLVEAATTPEVKSRPKRSLLVLASTLAAFIFLVIGVLFIESFKDQDWSFLKKW